MQLTDATVQLSGIVAADQDFLIGFNTLEKLYNEQTLPYRMPWNQGEMQDDMTFFRQTTAGHWLIMGRKTLQSIGRLLPGRLNLVFSRSQSLEFGKQVLRQSRDLSDVALHQLLQRRTAGLLLQNWEDLNRLLLQNGQNPVSSGFSESSMFPIFIIGGAQLFDEALQRQLLNDFYFTQIEARFCEKGTPDETPVLLPPQLRRILNQQIPDNQPIQQIWQNEKNRYNARIYHIKL